MLGRELEGLVRRGQAPRRIGGVHEAPRQERAEARVGRDVGGIGDGERGFDHCEVLRRAAVDAHEAAVAREGRA